MSGGFKFKNRTDALYNKQQAIARPGLRANVGPIISNIFWVKAPSGGIPAISGTTLGSADCDVYYIEDAGERTALEDSGGTQITVTVWNAFSEVVGDGGGWVMVAIGDGKYQPIAEDC